MALPSIPKMPANFFSQLGTLWGHLSTVNWAALWLGIVSIVTIVLWPKSYRPNHARWRRALARMPGTIAVMALGIVSVSVFGLQVDTIGMRTEQPDGTRRPRPPLAIPAFPLNVRLSCLACLAYPSVGARAQKH